ncbi:MAG: anthranilate synthase component I family protein [Spirochaetes bacterium]|nr:anthranilate synthase component I family protein [Spirochaetota bacterium]
MYYPSIDEVKKLSRKYNRIPVYKEMNISEPGMLMLLKTLQNDRNVIFLESAKLDKTAGRFSYLGFNPSRVVRFMSIDNEPFVFIENENSSTHVQETIFDFLKKEVAEYSSPEYKQFGSYNGGYTGYFGFDTINYTGILRSKVKEDANLPLASFALIDDFICLDNKINKHFLATVIYTDDSKNIEDQYNEALKVLQKNESDIIRKISQTTIPYMPSFAKELPLKFRENKDEFAEKVKKIKQLIHDGEAIQVVLSMRAEIENKIDPYIFFLKLRDLNPSPYMYFLKLNDLRIVGSSPEIHVKIDRSQIHLKPIAGTILQGSTREENRRHKEILLNDPKERAEHLMLVDLGRNDLGRVSKPGTVKVSHFMQPEDYSHVIHLVTDVKGTLRSDKNMIDVIKETFPAGTISGAPKVRAIEIIDECETIARGIYSGAIGYIGFNGYADTCITIRTAYFTPDGDYLQAGAGIVMDSVPEKEYEEIRNKLKALAVSLPFAEV